MPVGGLDGPCGACGRTAGDHTLREWAACLGTATTDLPYEPVPADAAQLASEAVRQRFGFEPGTIVADHVVVRAATIDGASGPVQIKVPVLLHEFQVGVAGGAPVMVAKVAFIADIDGMRAYGRLSRDSANGAANAAGRAAA